MRKEAKKFVWFFVLMVGILALPLVVSGQTMVWYVDDDAGGAHNGTSWADAFTNLQDALAVAYYGDEIRVGQGSYTPDTGSGYSLGYRGASFGLKSGVTIYGGYAGVGADYPNDRIVDLYKTILSGDLNDDDNRELFESDTLGILAGIGEEFWSSGLGLQHDLDNDGEVDFDDVIFLLNAYNYDDNSIHVVTASWEVSGAILDGLYICGGSTHGSFDASGGGVYNYGEITMNDCVLSHNLCYYYPGLDATQGGGGGMVSLGSEAELSECTFSLNVSWGGGGGGMYNSTDYCDLIDCDFNDNRAMKVQGDAQMYYGGNGGGLYNIGDNLTLMEGLIVDNRAGVHGGGMYNTGENLAGEDSVFRCNSAEEKGGGGYNSADNFTTTSCYFYLNSALEGDGLYNWSDNFSMSAGTIDALAGYVGLSSDINLGLEESLVVRDQLTIGGDTAITGGGEIVVEFGGELRLESMATVDLSWGKGGKGLIQCDGFLEATDYTNIQYVRLNVSCSNFNYSASISNSIITTQGDLPYGQFEIQDGASVILNEIHSAGDHYLDLNPPNYYGLLELNEIYVTVSEGAGGVEGDMLEVRGVDGLLNSYIPDPNNPYLGRAPAGTTPDFFTDSWTLEELRIEDNAKVTLVNRFDYQYPYDTGGAEEVVYVKNLILGENAVLNTSFNRIYYENLVIAPTAVVPNRALTALSLGTIDFNSDQEFLNFVGHNNFFDSAQPDFNRIHVDRVEGLLPDPCGMMRMRTLSDFDPGSSTFGDVFSARAKTKFGTTSEDKIVIQFEYLFDANYPDMELVIYLSDIETLLPYDDEGRDDHYIEVGRLVQPPQGRPGAFGSERFGVFQLEISPGMMDLSQGFWIEFDFMGPPGSTMYMSMCSTMVLCDPLGIYCKDVSGDFGVTAKDYLYIFGEYGNVASPMLDPMAPLGRACLDGSFNRDGYLDIHDLTEWDWFLSPPDRLNQCDIPLTTGMSGSSVSSDRDVMGGDTEEDYYLPGGDIEALDGATESLLMVSKWIHNISPYYLQDTSYLFDETGQVMSSPPPAFSHMGGRLIADKKGNVYQIHLEDGLVGLWDPNVAIIGPGSFSGVTEPRYGMSSTVYVGLQAAGIDWTGRPLVDAAIDEDGFIYVLPVVVVPTGSPDSAYLAAAKLDPNIGPVASYSLVKLYDDPPAAGDNQERNALREIEVDDEGNLYVINSHELNESDMLWVFDTTSGTVEQKLNFKDRSINAPTAMHISDANDVLYLTSSQNAPDAVTTSLVGLSTTDLSVVRTVSITGMGHVTCITEDPVNGTLWAGGFKMENIPMYPDPASPVFYYPFLAQVPAGSSGPIAAVSVSGAGNMSLPMSMVWIGPLPDLCGGADMNNDGSVDLGDLSIMVQYWLDVGCTTPEGCGKANLDNADGKDTVNLLDFAYFAQYWLWDC